MDARPRRVADVAFRREFGLEIRPDLQQGYQESSEWIEADRGRCEFNEEDEEGNPIPIPDYFEGKKVVGIDYGYLVGEELGLTSDSEEYQFQYTEEEIDALSEWIKKSGFKLNDEIIASVKNALK
jgi:hypothetical protein